MTTNGVRRTARCSFSRLERERALDADIRGGEARDAIRRHGCRRPPPWELWDNGCKRTVHVTPSELASTIESTQHGKGAAAGGIAGPKCGRHQASMARFADPRACSCCRCGKAGHMRGELARTRTPRRVPLQGCDFGDVGGQRPCRCPRWSRATPSIAVPHPRPHPHCPYPPHTLTSHNSRTADAVSTAAPSLFSHPPPPSRARLLWNYDDSSCGTRKASPRPRHAMWLGSLG